MARAVPVADNWLFVGSSNGEGIVDVMCEYLIRKITREIILVVKDRM
jgi:hypothetical protein